MMKKNECFTVAVDSMNDRGYGVCRIDGVVVFIRGAVCGDVCRIKIIKVCRSYCVAVAEEIITPSRERAKLRCSLSRCGGCVFQSISFECENRLKREFVRYALLKAGVDIETAEVLHASAPSGYRNKAQYPLTALPDGRIAAGFYAEKTHEVIPCARCDISPEIFSDIVALMCDFFTRRGLSVYNEATGEGLLRHIYLRCGSAGEEIMVCVVINADALPAEDALVSLLCSRFAQIKSIFLNINRRDTNVILGDEYRLLYGREYISDTLCSMKFNINPRSFYQVNHDCTEILYAEAARLLDVNENDCVLDLYCGVGTVGLCTARGAGQLYGIEIVEQAVADARMNAAENNVANTRFFVADSADLLRVCSTLPERITAVVVDPPRKGLDRRVIEQIITIAPRRVVYISCEPNTLARDLKIFGEYGYTASCVTPINMFPRTSHIETVTLITHK